MKYHQIIYSKNRLENRFKLYYTHRLMLSFDSLNVKKAVMMNLHGTVVDKFEGDVLAEMLNNKWLDLDGNTRYMYMLVR